MANAVALFALARPNDLLMVQSSRAGANWSYLSYGVPRLLGIRVEEMAPSSDYGIDLTGLRERVKQVRPVAFVVGGSVVLFPYPVQELREIANEVGARILFDAAHLGPFIAAGMFQDPFAEGADVLTLGTHKMMAGPVGGLAMTNDVQIAKAMIGTTYPLFMQTRDQNKYAAAAYSLAETLAFGRDYALQTLTNARVLARALEGEGFRPLFADRKYTETHQFMIDARDLGAEAVERRCQDANILLHKARLPGESENDVRGGLRLSVQELTRQGMREQEMHAVARLIARAGLHREDCGLVARDVEDLVSGFREVKYSFRQQSTSNLPVAAHAGRASAKP
jgi:glycine hydroxymethyltransferase